MISAQIALHSPLSSRKEEPLRYDHASVEGYTRPFDASVTVFMYAQSRETSSFQLNPTSIPSTMAYYFFEMIPRPVVDICVVLGLLCLVFCIFEKYVSNMSSNDLAETVETKSHQHSLRYQLGKLLAQQLGYFRNAEGTRIKELAPNSRFLRFSNG
jgi:hypothetical protein